VPTHASGSDEPLLDTFHMQVLALRIFSHDVLYAATQQATAMMSLYHTVVKKTLEVAIAATDFTIGSKLTPTMLNSSP